MSDVNMSPVTPEQPQVPAAQGTPQVSPVTPSVPDTSLYSKLQSERDSAIAEADKLAKKLNKIENLPELERQASQAEAKRFEAEAVIARNSLVREKFPHLVGKENHVKLGTLEEMAAHAEQLTKDFGLKPATSNAPEVPYKGAAGGDGSGANNDATINALANMSEAQLKETLQRLPNEELAKIVGGSSNGQTPSSLQSPYSGSFSAKQ